MLTFMDYVQRSFNESSGWNPYNSYRCLTYTSQGLSYPFPLPLSPR